MPELYELRSNNPGFVGPNDPEGQTCGCGNTLAFGDSLERCADGDCRELGCDVCQVRCEGCGNWFCRSCAIDCGGIYVCVECEGGDIES